MGSRRETFGRYTAIEGKLSTEDARAAYVTGPAGDGVIRPIASFWSYAEAVAFARKRSTEQP